MLFPYAELPLDDRTWRRINMRKVAHLIGAEMIHNLYNRHWPRINSLRFRHTITNFKQGTVESFAPVQEWSYLQHWLAKKFVATDPVLIREIEAIMNPDYKFVNEIMQKVDTTELEKISNQELALLLIDIMDFPLGDIYKLNVVQIEYSLNFALHKVLEQYEPNALDRNALLARLIAPGELTIAQEEEVAFSKIVSQGRQKSVANPSTDESIMQLIEDHHDTYGPTHSAYGENPPAVQDYANKYIFMFSLDKPLLTREEAENQVARQLDQSRKLLGKLKDDKLAQLCDLMARIGVFRDRNKAKLGETVVRRLRLLDEISRRSGVSREDINYYLMAEIAALLDDGSVLPDEVMQKRMEHGVCFERNEDVISGIKLVASSAGNTAIEDVMQGICASSGEISGEVKIILSKDDISKINPGDIMVAIGTDFDLLEIMNLSGGIITEEGGLLSHASVVSRELKKPCLIGVSQATKLLHDGDMIRLNTTEGKIFIIKRAE